MRVEEAGSFFLKVALKPDDDQDLDESAKRVTLKIFIFS